MSDRYCVIGNPIAHSKSPAIHAAFAAQTGQNLTYERCLAPIDAFAATVAGLVEQGFRGANVTVPFKLEAAQLAGTLTERADAAGAVNTLVLGSDGIVGDNTDGAGLVRDIVHNAGFSIQGKRVLMLGAGGAARGAMLPLLGEQPRELIIANRTKATAEALVDHFGGPGRVIAACEWAGLTEPFDLIINATSASLSADLPPIPGVVFSPSTLALDMMYGNKPTVFMEFASHHGAIVRDGLGMLVEQAAEAFALWRGVRPHTSEVLASLRSTL